MEAKRLLPFIVALLVLALALGSLSRSQAGGNSLLLNSYWLLYALYFLPVIALIALVAMTIAIAYYWRSLSDAIGFGMAQKRKQARRKNRTFSFLIWIFAWGFAIMFLLEKCGSIPCSISNKNMTSAAVNAVVGTGTPSDLPSFLGNASVAIGNFLGNEWYVYAFIGLVVVSSVIVLRAVKVSWNETKLDLAPSNIMTETRAVAVEEAIKIVESPETPDPRMKILYCYQRMIKAASDLGASISQDQTARELELGIQKTLMLKGSAIDKLTQLFEEARYSLHRMTMEDSSQAHDCLLSIAEELNLQISVHA